MLKNTCRSLILLCVLIVLTSFSGVAAPVEFDPQVGAVGNHIAFSRDGNFCADGNVLWDLTTMKILRVFPRDGMVYTSELSADAGTMVICDDDGVRSYDTNTGRALETLGNDGSYRCAACSPIGHFVAGGSVNGNITIWGDKHTPHVIASFDGEVLSSAFSSNGNYLVAAGMADGKAIIRAWTTNDWRPVQTIQTEMSAIHSLALGEANEVAASSGDNFAVWDFVTGKRLLAPTRSQRIAVCSTSKRLINLGPAIDYGFGSVIECRSLTNNKLIWKHEEGSLLTDVAASPDGRFILISSPGALEMLDMHDGHQISVMSAYGQESVGNLYLSPDSRALGTASTIWDLDTGRSYPVSGMQSFGQDNTYCGIVKEELSEHVTMHSFDGLGELRQKDIPIPRPAKAMVICENETLSHDHSLLARVEDFSNLGPHPLPGFDEISVWKSVAGSEVSRFGRRTQNLNSGDAVASLVFSNDGQYLAASTFKGQSARCWQVQSGKQCAEMEAAESPVFSIAFSPDNKLLAGGCLDGSVVLWDLASGRIVNRVKAHRHGANALVFDGSDTLYSGGDDGWVRSWSVPNLEMRRQSRDHDSAITSLAVSPGAKSVVSRDLLGTIAIREGLNGKLAATIYDLNGHDSVIKTDGNYYFATPGAHDAIAFRVGRHVYPFEVFDTRYNRPDIVIKALGSQNTSLQNDYKRACQARWKWLDVPDQDASSTAAYDVPTCLPLSGFPASSNSSEFKLRIAGSDQLHPIKQLLVWVNDVPAVFQFSGQSASGSRGLLLRKAARGVSGTISLTLSPGTNKVQIAFVNDLGTQSLKYTFNISCSVPAKKNDLYVLAVGVSLYADPGMTNLQSAANDAILIGQFFKSQGWHYAHPPTVKVLPNAQATRANILAAAKVLAEAKQDDEVVVFFAGHSVPGKDRNGQPCIYFGTADITRADPAAQGLTYDQITDLVDGIPCRRKFVMLDACQSGPVGPTRLVNESAPSENGDLKVQSVETDPAFIMQQDLFANLVRGSGATIIAATRGDKAATEVSDHGYFAQAVIESLRETPHQTISQLLASITGRIEQESEQTQQPITRSENLAQNYPVIPE